MLLVRFNIETSTSEPAEIVYYVYLLHTGAQKKSKVHRKREFECYCIIFLFTFCGATNPLVEKVVLTNEVVTPYCNDKDIDLWRFNKSNSYFPFIANAFVTLASVRGVLSRIWTETGEVLFLSGLSCSQATSFVVFVAPVVAVHYVWRSLVKVSRNYMFCCWHPDFAAEVQQAVLGTVLDHRSRNKMLLIVISFRPSSSFWPY